MLSDKLPRLSLAHLPTPLEPVPALEARLDGPRLWIKRDDCTGLATGGNKTRKLEYLLADARARGADCVLTAGGIQSNHARQTAAAAAKLGLGCEILLEDTRPGADPDYRNNGNLLLDRLYGASIRRYPRDWDMDKELERRTEALRQQGRRPYPIPIGGSNALGALGYVRCAEELVTQSRDLGFDIDLVVHASGSAGTQAGLLAGFCALGVDIPVLGICVSRGAAEQQQKVRVLTDQTLETLGLQAGIDPRQVRANGDYVGDGYGIPTRGMVEAVSLVAQTEGILLDPVYTGKAMAGLIDLVRKEEIAGVKYLVFLHTGGAAALFAYRSTFADGDDDQNGLNAALC